MNEKILDFFFRAAEKGDWEVLSMEDAIKGLKINEKELKKVVPDKNYFLVFYNEYLDKKVLESISEEDIQNSSSDEVLQEYLMTKLEFMNKYKLAIANIINTSLKNNSFILLSLKSNKKSIKNFVEKATKEKSIIKKNILIKLILGLWLISFNKWLYENYNNESSFSFIDKGIKKIKNNFQFFK